MIKLFENFRENYDDTINKWKNKWMGTCAEDFPERFIKEFPTKDDYQEWEKDMYDYQDEDDQWEFDPEDEVYNIKDLFSIVIGADDKSKSTPYKDKDGYCYISVDNWVDFYNDINKFVWK